MAEISYIGLDVYLEYTYDDGHKMVSYHRVWDLQLFLRSKSAEGRKGNKPEDRFVIRRVKKDGSSFV